MNRDGKGAVKENTKPTLAFFFKSLVRKFPQLLRLNLLMLFQILPLIFIAIVFLAGDKTPSATSTTYAPLLGIDQVLSTPSASHTLDMSLIQMGLPVFSTAVTCTIIVLGLFLLITWGWQNIGATYVLRGLVRGDAVFVFTDYFYAIKRNLKQGLLVGVIDLILSSVLVIDFIYFYQRTGQFGMDFMYFVIFALAIVYFIMRFYIYLLLITFDMKTFKIVKNSFIFSILALMIWFLISTPLGFTMILPFIYILALTAFMSAYAAYPIIDKYLIEPYATEDDDEDFVYLKPADDTADETSVT